MVAHDMRSSLAIISAYSEFALEAGDESLDAESHTFVQEIFGMSHFLLSVVDQPLDRATIESGNLRLELAPTDLVALVEHNVGLNAVLTSAKHIALQVTCASDVPLVALDVDKIRQALNNLIGNAIKYSPAGAQVNVRVTHDEHAVVVAVEDTGSVIPADELEGLFRPFSVSSVKATAGEKRTGLGLAISRRIVEGHGGKLTVTSTVGAGSTFTFTLPLHRPAAQPAPPAAALLAVPAEGSMAQNPEEAADAPEAPARPLAVLLAEDNLPNQKIILYLLREIGCDVEAVETGVKALAALHRRPFDLVLMDVRMPEMSGIEATQHLRRELPPEAQPVVYALTAGVGEDEVQACLAAGMNGFLAKPVVRAELAALCATHWPQ